jgi:hypothetical protein
MKFRPITQHKRHAVKAYMRCKCVALRILNLGTRWSSVVSLTTQHISRSVQEQPDPNCKMRGGLDVVVVIINYLPCQESKVGLH